MRSVMVVLALALTLPCLAQNAALPVAWQTQLGVEHPLVGVIWDVQAAHAIDQATLVERLAKARFVLLGEKHDNPDHHRLQACIFSALLKAGRKPALAFEMLDADDAPAVQAYLAGKPADAAGLGAAVGWDKKSWPAWAWYQQIADPAVSAGLPIVAANLAERLARGAARQGLGALPPEMVETLGLEGPIPDAVRTAMGKEIADSHCGFAPPGMVEPMILVQRARDAHMAEAVRKGATADGAVLITGFGHARTDRAVPLQLVRRGAKPVASLAILEVEKGKDTAPSYAAAFDAARLPFDFVWFTPRVDDLDPCEKFKAKLEKLKAAKPAATPVSTP